jgi:two-component system, LytTR family, response regulator
MTGPIRVMIVDDESPAREGLRLRLRAEPDVAVIGEYGDPVEAVAAIAGDAPDLVFLDIQMPGMDGFDLVGRLKGGPMPLVVFVTAYDEHAVRAFGVAALDYLLKPVEPERLREAVARARAELERRRKGDVLDELRGVIMAREGDAPAAVSPRRRGVERIPVRRADGIGFVPVDDVDFVEAAGDSVRIHARGSVHRVSQSMGRMLAMLDPDRFVRIHRSTIVNIDRVKSLQPYFHGEHVVVLEDGTQLKLSRGYKSAVSRLVGER